MKYLAILLCLVILCDMDYGTWLLWHWVFPATSPLKFAICMLVGANWALADGVSKKHQRE